MDCRVPVSIRGAKGLPFFPTAAKSLTTRGRALPLFGCLLGSRQRGLGQRGRQGSKARVLRQPGISWCREEVSTHGKLALALVTAAHKLKPYFQAHTVIILTKKPLRRAMSNPEAVGRLVLWVIELSEFDIQYCRRIAIKG